MNENSKWLNNFIREVVDGWMLNDLKRLINDIPHRSSEAGNCNFPIALYIFACIEFLGQLTLSTPMSGSSYTQASIMGFIDDFFPDNFKEKLRPYRDNFVNIFRNGLAHNYFAKYAGVSRTESEPLQVNADGMLILDADLFTEAFRSGINKLKKSIQTDPHLVHRIVERYNTQYKESSLRFRATPTTTSFVSGASLAHPSMLKNLKSTTTMPPPPKPDNDV